MADATDLKSVELIFMPVRVRSPAPGMRSRVKRPTPKSTIKALGGVVALQHINSNLLTKFNNYLYFIKEFLKMFELKWIIMIIGIGFIYLFIIPLIKMIVWIIEYRLDFAIDDKNNVAKFIFPGSPSIIVDDFDWKLHGIWDIWRLHDLIRNVINRHMEM